jgi:hypothetical protein
VLCLFFYIFFPNTASGDDNTGSIIPRSTQWTKAGINDQRCSCVGKTKYFGINVFMEVENDGDVPGGVAIIGSI